jgi:O-acetyl-ADP-ribose deacetylase (regulator of RNase III)
MTTISIIENSNIFNSQCQTIVNTINCIGVPEKGLSLIFKEQYPDMFEKYKGYCDKGFIEIGKLWLYKNEEKWILNFPIKKDCQNTFEYDYIEKGLQKFLETYKEKNITSIAFPILGATNNCLDKNKILEKMLKYFSQCQDIIIEIYI